MQKFDKEDTVPFVSQSEYLRSLETARLEQEGYQLKQVRSREKRISILMAFNGLIKCKYLLVTCFLPGLATYRVEEFFTMADSYFIEVELWDEIIDKTFRVSVPYYTVFPCYLGKAYNDERETMRV